MTIETEVRQGWHDAIIEMFEIDLSTIAEGFTGQYFLTNEVMPDNSLVRWKGQTYTAFPIAAGGFDVSIKGQMPQPEITIANVFGSFSSLVSEADDLVGAKVTRRRTLFKYLDNGPSPDQNQEFPDDIFYIERKTAETNIAITWQLASKIDLEGLLLPRRVITQNHCLWRYKGSECGYSGPPVANEFDALPSGGSPEANTYAQALEALLAANAAVNSAQAELNAARTAQEIVCEIGIVERSKPRFKLRNPPYTFGILDSTTYFAAYNDNTLIPAENFEAGPFGLQPEEGDAILGERQNTRRGPSNNGTGTIWAVNRWVGVAAGGEPPTIEAQLANENEYNPPRTFAMVDLSGNVLIARNGEIKSNVSSVEPGRAPSISGAGQVVFARGERRESNKAPVVDIRVWELSSAQCDSATARFEAAEEALIEAEAAQTSAQAAYDAALAALPDDDPIREQDRCGKRLSSCRLRFGTATLPFGAFPGANLYR